MKNEARATTTTKKERNLNRDAVMGRERGGGIVGGVLF